MTESELTLHITNTLQLGKPLAFITARKTDITNAHNYINRYRRRANQALKAIQGGDIFGNKQLVKKVELAESGWKVTFSLVEVFSSFKLLDSENQEE